MRKKHIAWPLIILIVVAVVFLVYQSPLLQTQTKNTAQENSLTQLIEQNEFSPEEKEVLKNLQPVVKEEKNDCKENMLALKNSNNPTLIVESGKIQVTFTSGTSLNDAIAILNKESVSVEEVLALFPVGSSQENIFNQYRTIKGVTSGDEITAVCNLLEESSVKDATLSITTNAAGLLQGLQ